VPCVETFENKTNKFANARTLTKETKHHRRCLQLTTPWIKKWGFLEVVFRRVGKTTGDARWAHLVVMQMIIYTTLSQKVKKTKI